MDLPYKLWAEYATLSLTLTSIPPFATVQTQIFAHSSLASTIAVNFIEVLVLRESSTSSALLPSRKFHPGHCTSVTQVLASFINGPSMGLVFHFGYIPPE